MIRSLKSVTVACNLIRRLPKVSAGFYSDIPKDNDLDATIDPINLIPPIPKYDIEKDQTLEHRKARLHYQSRKRGMLENDLLLSTFAKKYLNGLNEEQTMMYDRLINSPSNDWDIYYWMIEKQPTPKEYDNEIMDMLKLHARNESRLSLRMPELN